MNSGFDSFKGKRVLLLQGPVGPFFWRFARDLQWAGAQVCKVNFNGGDWLFYPFGSINFYGRMEQWPVFFARIIEQRKIDVVLLLGDCRPVHAVIHDIASRLGVDVGVFEEGYVRPDYITLEAAGVNGYSRLPRSPIFYLNARTQPTPEPMRTANTFSFAILWAVLYYLASAVLSPLFRHYRHHRPLNPLEALPWVRSLWRKVFFQTKERRILAQLTSTLSGNYFLVPLQVHNDAQIRVHSKFASVHEFILQTMQSFAENAPSSTLLVIKHHPLDRGYRDYGKLIRKEADRLGIADRVMVIHDQHLPALLEHARGVVVINSTVGFSSVHHDTPVIVCGSAVYDMQGLTFQGELDTFWQSAQNETIDRNLYWKFRDYLIAQTQLNGNFYNRMNVPGSHSGLMWRPVPAAASVTEAAVGSQAGMAET